jgi:hypothetical protein
MPTPPPIVDPATLPRVETPKDVPWWGALILAILTAIVSVIGTIYALRGQRPAVGGPPGIAGLFTDTVTYLPHILVLFGVLADIFTMSGVYSIPSLVGLLSILTHYGLQFVWVGAQTMLSDVYKLATTAPINNFTPPTNPAAERAFARREAQRSAIGGAIANYSGCEIQGFESWKSPYAPQGLVVTSTIFWYYLLDLIMNRNIFDGIGTIVTFTLFTAFQAFVLRSCEDLAGSVAIKTFISLVEGFISGGIGYSIVQVYAPNRLPSSLLPQGPSASSLKTNSSGELVDSSGNVYVIGPGGKPIPKNFVTQACAAASGSTGGTQGSNNSTTNPSSAGTCSN